MPSNQPSNAYLRAHGNLKTIVVLVAIYGTCMVMLGRSVAMPLFDGLGFGPNSKGLNSEAIDYCIFMFGVLGAVIVGWMTLMWNVLQHLAIHSDPSVRTLARKSLIFSTATWFVLDTGYSIAIHEYEHAAFNFPFVTSLAIPLYLMSNADYYLLSSTTTKKKE